MKTSNLIMLMILLVSVMVSLSAIKPIEAAWTTYYIEANGSIFPSTTLIVRNGDLYTLAGNISGAIVIEKDSVVIDGAGHAIEGPAEIGVNFTSRTNVTLSNAVIDNFDYGIFLTSSNNNSIVECYVTGCLEGIWLEEASNYNVILGNTLTGNSFDGIYVSYSSGNGILKNQITQNTGDGVQIQSSSNNSVFTNTIANNGWGIESYYSSNNSLFHNNLISNTVQVHSDSSLDYWDDGYPSGGNYWSNYLGVDNKCGPNQDHLGSDGIGDTPYFIDSNNQDNYPLTSPWTPPSGHNVAVISVVSSKTVIFQGFSGNITLYGANKGEYPETYNVIVYANTTPINSKAIALDNSSTIALTFSWNTTGFPKGNYTIDAYAQQVLGETNIADNNFTGGLVAVSIVGDLTGTVPNVPDGKCDIRDIAFVAKCFGSVPGSPGWNANCDVNNDGKVDIRDIAIVAKHFGEAG